MGVGGWGGNGKLILVKGILNGILLNTGQFLIHVLPKMNFTIKPIYISIHLKYIKLTVVEKLNI